MKAIIEKGKTYKVTGERGDFTICEDNKGKAKMFRTITIEIVDIDEMPKAKKYKNSIRKMSEHEIKEYHEDMANAKYYEHKF